MQGKALPGFRDFYPEDLKLRNHIFATWRSVASRYGFEEYDGPPLESLEMYTKKSGDEIVQQLYTFRDKGDREVALRPEMTPTLARMVDGRLTICGVLFGLCHSLAGRGALLLAASDKPAESAIPSPEQLAAGLLPLHHTPARVE